MNRRTPIAPHEEAEMRAESLAHIDVSEVSADEAAEFFPALPVKLFEHQYGRVRTDKVIQATGMPPAEWSLL